jgi:hypothetical protein
MGRKNSRSTNVAKEKAVNDKRPCRRCGTPMYWGHNSKVPGICRDCRDSDPAFVAACALAQPIVATPVDRESQARASRRREQWTAWDRAREAS